MGAKKKEGGTMSVRGSLWAGLGATLLLGACATAPEKPPAKPTTDEFQGFASLRGEGRKKKPAADEEGGEKGEEKGAKGEEKGAKGEEKGAKGGEDKTPLSKEQVIGAIDTAKKRVDSCLKKFKDPGIYVLQITISPEGTCEVEPMRAPTRKEDAELWKDVDDGLDGGKSPKSPTSKCLATAMKQVSFPKFEGKPLVVTYPLILR